MSHDRPITVGVVGVRRGRAFARGSEAATGQRRDQRSRRYRPADQL